MIEKLYIMFVNLFDRLLWVVDIGSSVHQVFLAPQIGNFRVWLGRIRAVRTYRYAVARVPAYRDYLKKYDFQGPKVTLGSSSLGDIPEMDKESYIKQYSLIEKVVNGKLPAKGVMFDESSGSSGKPTSWVRGAKERRITQRIMQVAYHHAIAGRQPVVLNTFSMGAWATGLNTTLCLLGITRVKSIGPDITKVIDTLIELGDGFDYVILGYPPFLRQVAEAKEINFTKYRISAIFGGEGISESMRETLLHYYSEVIGSYGASDLEINIAHESKFTIALRQAIAKDDKLRDKLLQVNRGIIPMIFQYNPFDYLFETNDKGELLVTICRTENLSPRIRYNIHDLGHAENFYDLKKILTKLGYGGLLELAELDFGVLFHYGRSDLSVDYNGAVVGPEEVKQILNHHDVYKDKLNSFRLISYEDAESHKHLLIAVELVKGIQFSDKETSDLLDYVTEKLREMNLDFRSAYRTAPKKPEIKLYKFEDGIFDTSHQKLKNDYVWNIDYNRAVSEGIMDK